MKLISSRWKKKKKNPKNNINKRLIFKKMLLISTSFMKYQNTSDFVPEMQSSLELL